MYVLFKKLYVFIKPFLHNLLLPDLKIIRFINKKRYAFLYQFFIVARVPIKFFSMLIIPQYLTETYIGCNKIQHGRIPWSEVDRFMATHVLVTWSATNARNSSFQSNPTIALHIADVSTDDSFFGPVRNKRTRLWNSFLFLILISILIFYAYGVNFHCRQILLFFFYSNKNEWSFFFLLSIHFCEVFRKIFVPFCLPDFLNLWNLSYIACIFYTFFFTRLSKVHIYRVKRVLVVHEIDRKARY